jgi:hypothetical protein
MKSSTKKTSKQPIKYLFYIAILFLIVWSIRGCIHNADLKAYNKVTTGYVYKISYTRNGRYQLYYFYVDGIRYKGKIREVYSHYEVGDSLLIRYFPADPNNNKSEKEFQHLK